MWTRVQQVEHASTLVIVYDSLEAVDVYNFALADGS